MIWLAATAWAQATCTPVQGATALADLPAPAIVVLGERKGTPLDLRRAARLVRSLQRETQPVTVALEAIDTAQQPALDDWIAGRLTADALPDALQIAERYGFSHAPYTRLLDTALTGADLVGVGLPYTAAPADTPLLVPPGYSFQLVPTMGGSPVPAALEETFAAAMAWRAAEIANRALGAWNGTGYLVIVADRALVEGGLGVSWQLQRQTETPVRAIVLADADGPCLPGDRVWRDLLGR